MELKNRKLAVLLVDAENIWRNLSRGLPMPGENPIGIDDFLQGVHRVRDIFIKQGFCVITFIFLPPHYCGLCKLEQGNEFIWVFCPSHYQSGQRHNSADNKIIRLGQIISKRGGQRVALDDNFLFISGSAISRETRNYFFGSRLIIFWHDGNDYRIRRKRRKKIRAALKYFMDCRHKVEEVCLLSGDSDFCGMVSGLRRSGIRVTISAEPYMSLSDKLTERADNFIPFPPLSEMAFMPTRE